MKRRINGGAISSAGARIGTSGLSEGFAEYSGILYTSQRAGVGASDDFISSMRESLRLPPLTRSGPGKGRLVDVGPIILATGWNQQDRGAYRS